MKVCEIGLVFIGVVKVFKNKRREKKDRLVLNGNITVCKIIMHAPLYPLFLHIVRVYTSSSARGRRKQRAMTSGPGTMASSTSDDEDV